MIIDLDEFLPTTQMIATWTDFPKIITSLFGSAYDKAEIYWSYQNSQDLKKMDEQTQISLVTIADYGLLLIVKTGLKQNKETSKNNGKTRLKKLETELSKMKNEFEEISKRVENMSQHGTVDFEMSVEPGVVPLKTHSFSQRGWLNNSGFSPLRGPTLNLDKHTQSYFGDWEMNSSSLEDSLQKKENLELGKFISNQEANRNVVNRPHNNSEPKYSSRLKSFCPNFGSSILEDDEYSESDLLPDHLSAVKLDRKANRNITDKREKSKHKTDSSQKTDVKKLEFLGTRTSVDKNRMPTFSKSKSDRSKKVVLSLNIFVLFSEPLIFSRGHKLTEEHNEGEVVKKDYHSRKSEKEMTEIHKNTILVGNFKKKLFFNPLTMDNFMKSIQFKPQIIHLVCRGRFLKTKNEESEKEYVLDFENEKGEAVMVGKESLEDLFKAVPLEACSILFISADSSEDILEVFQKQKPKVIIYLKSGRKVNVKLLKEFSRIFYYNLFKEFSIEKAFDSSVVLSSIAVKADPANYHRNCAHFHTEDCVFKDASPEELEFFYSSFNNCECEGRLVNIHDYMCDVTTNFSMTFDIELEGVVKIDETRYRICCCRADLSHEEADMFGIWYGKESYKNLVISKNTKLREMTGPSFYSFHIKEIDRPYQDLYTVGTENICYRLFRFFSTGQGKVAAIVGDRGSGKTTVAKRFANFASERHLLKVFFKRDLKEFVDLQSFEQALEKCSNSNDKMIQNKMENHMTIIILENCDRIIQRFPVGFFEKLSEKTEGGRFKIIITCRSEVELGDFNGVGVFEVPFLTSMQKLKLFYKKYKHNLEADDQNLDRFRKKMRKKLDSESGQLFSSENVNPAVIIKLANSDKPDLLDRFYDNLKEALAEFNQKMEEKKVSEMVEERFAKVYPQTPFLYFICMFERGLFFMDDLVGFCVFCGESDSLKQIVSFMERFLVSASKNEVGDKEELEACMEVTDKTEDTMTQLQNQLEKLNKLALQRLLKNENSLFFEQIQFSRVTFPGKAEPVLLLKHDYVFSLLKEHMNPRTFHMVENYFEFMNERFCGIIIHMLENYKIKEDSYFLFHETFNKPKMLSFSKKGNRDFLRVKTDLTVYFQLHLNNFLVFFEDPEFLLKNARNRDRSENCMVKFFDSMKEYLWNFSVLSHLRVFEIATAKQRTQFKLVFGALSFNQNVRKCFAESLLQTRIFELSFQIKKSQIEKYENKTAIISQKIEFIRELFESQGLNVKSEKYEWRLRVMNLEFLVLRAKAYRFLNKTSERRTKRSQTDVVKHDIEYSKAIGSMTEDYLVNERRDELPLQLAIKILFYQNRFLEETRVARFAESSFCEEEVDENGYPIIDMEQKEWLGELMRKVDLLEDMWNPNLFMQIGMFICKICLHYNLGDDLFGKYFEKMKMLDLLAKNPKFNSDLESLQVHLNSD